MPTRPSIPNREGAILWVPPSRGLGVNMAGAGAVMILLAVLALSTQAHPRVWLHGTVIAAGLLILLTGLRTVIRKTPVLAADDQGLFVSITGTDRTLLPWEAVQGADVVGSHGTTELVILSADVESALRHVFPSLAREARARNRRHSRPGAVYIMDRVCAERSGVIAARIRELLGEGDQTAMLLARGAAPAGAGEHVTSPEGTSRSSHPA